MRAKLAAWLRGMLGYVLLAGCFAAGASLLTWSATDPSFIRTTGGVTRNALGVVGANVSDLAMRLVGLAAVVIVLPPLFWALQLITRRQLEEARMKLMLAPVAVLLIASAVAALPAPASWPLPYGLGGLLGDQALRFFAGLLTATGPERASMLAGAVCLVGGMILLTGSLGMSLNDLRLICQGRRPLLQRLAGVWGGLISALEREERLPPQARREPTFDRFPTLAGAPGTMTVGRDATLPIEPAFGYAPPSGLARDRDPVPAAKRLRRPVQEREPAAAHDPEAERRPDIDPRTMAERFAPSRDEPDGPSGFARFRRPGRHADPAAGSGTAPKAIWPGSVPVPTEELQPVLGDQPASDALYGRAVALVRAHRKASASYLQQSLGIGYMRAADLIDRMEREGIVGAPIHNGLRPILGSASRTRMV